jgi:cytochrome c553
MFSVPDWRPYRHPPMPEIVASGRRPEVFACGYCHLPNGQGRPENASLAGLPVAHIIQQMADFRSGLRKSSDPKHKPVMAMIAYETKTHVAGWMPVASRPGGMEPIGRRIIEMPENLERAELRDDASGFVAYVPAGSIQKGKALVTGGRNEKTVACDTCHGADLQGLRDGPSIAGRSSSYIVRQLFDIQGGARAGAKTQWMNSLVEKLSLDELISIAAYAASLRP